MTIREMAEQIGVSKTAVRKKMESTGVRERFAETVDGVLHLTQEGERLITSAFAESAPLREPTGNGLRKPLQTDAETVTAATVKALTDQLSVKDAQIAAQQQTIDSLTTALQSATGVAQAAQALHAGTLQGLPSVRDKKPFWARFSRSKDDA